MNRKLLLLAILFFSGGLIGLIRRGATSAQAQIQAETTVMQTASITQTSQAFTYQGHLDIAGTAFSGTCFMDFKVYDKNDVAINFFHAQVEPLVNVTDGVFTVLLNANGELGPDLFTGEQRFLGVGVECPPDASGMPGPNYGLLYPYTEISATPYAQMAYTLQAGAVISGELFEEPVLKLHNEIGIGLYISGTAHGAVIIEPSENGLVIGEPGENGVLIFEPNNSGVAVLDAKGVGVFATTVGDGSYGGMFMSETPTSTIGYGIFAEGNQESAPDIVLGGYNGVIVSDVTWDTSDIELASRDKLAIVLDSLAANTGEYFGVFSESNTPSNRIFYVDEDGDVFGKSFNTIVRGADGVTTLFGSSMLQQRIEDFGTATLVDGAVTVLISAEIKSIAKLTQDYQLFLTPRGACHLYIAETTATSFTIQMIGDDKACAGVAFDYHLVADSAEVTPQYQEIEDTPGIQTEDTGVAQ